MNENNEKEQVAESCEYIPVGKLEKILYLVYKNKQLSEILHIISYVIAFLTVYAFIWRIAVLIEDSSIEIVSLLITTGVPFVALSVMRRLINAPRPYELLSFYETKPKSKKGRSFPSRHVFSIFIIATVLLPWNIFIGIGLFLLGFAMAVIRVLLGMHFIRDVFAGALAGVICGVIGIITLV